MRPSQKLYNNLKTTKIKPSVLRILPYFLRYHFLAPPSPKKPSRPLYDVFCAWSIHKALGSNPHNTTSKRNIHVRIPYISVLYSTRNLTLMIRNHNESQTCKCHGRKLISSIIITNIACTCTIDLRSARSVRCVCTRIATCYFEWWFEHDQISSIRTRENSNP